MAELKAKPGCCEEAAPESHEFYIPCNRPATSVVAFVKRGEGPYRMCTSCAAHNVHNRGAEVVAADWTPPVHEYLFDFEMLGSCRVRAKSEATARALLREVLDCADINAGAWPPKSPDAGKPILFEASADGDFDLIEVDGEDA